MTEPVLDTSTVAVEVTDPDGEQIRIRPHPRDERGSTAALEYRHEHYDEWVHIVALDPDDLARLADFARLLVWAAHPGDAGAEIREALYGSTPVGPVDPGVSRGLMQTVPPSWDRWRESLDTPAGGVGGLGEAARAAMSGTVTVRVPASEEFIAMLGGVEEFCRRMSGQVCEAPEVSARAGEDLYASLTFVTGKPIGPGYAVVTAAAPVPEGQQIGRLTRDLYVTIRPLAAGESMTAGAP